MNLGLTSHGLSALGVPAEVLEQFDSPFVRGPHAGALGDVAGSPSDPAGRWEGRFATGDVHAVVHLHLRPGSDREQASRQVRDLARRHGLTELVPRRDGSVLDGLSLGGRRLHFGYTEGISHPDVCWEDVAPRPGQVDRRAFLLGDATPEHPSAPWSGAAAQLARDSTYGVLPLDPPGRRGVRPVPAHAGAAPLPRPRACRCRGAAGRQAHGALARRHPARAGPEGVRSRAGVGQPLRLRTRGPRWHRCPFSAHVRVVNPRDQRLDAVAEHVPHVIRRVSPYGPPLTSPQDDGRDRGILEIFLGTDVRRQVYTLTRWIGRNDFSPVFGDERRLQDPLVANRAVPGTRPDFVIPRPEGPLRVSGLPDFVHTKGTLLLLYPSLGTLAALTGAPDGGPPARG